jgi:menaquinone-dependent protoporphyrinogen oxidase
MARRILVVYGTTEGQTQKIAFAIGEEMSAHGAVVDIVDARYCACVPTLRLYDATIVAASVHAAGYQRAVRRWVARRAAELAEKPNAFVSVCLGVLEHKPEVDRELERIMTRFFERTGWTPAIRKIVAGALPYSRYGWLKRRIIRRIVAKAGGDIDTSRDYEYTDWQDVRAFAREFLKRVPERASLTPAAVA